MGYKAKCFRLVLWKNYKAHFSHPIQAAIEILSPVMFGFLLVFLRSLVLPETFTEDTTYDAFDVLRYVNDSPKFLPYITNIAYSPCNNSKIRQVMQMTQKALRIANATEAEDSETLELFLGKPENVPIYVGGVQFSDKLLGLDSLDKITEVTLRFPSDMRYERTERFASSWKTDKLFSVYEPPGPRSPMDMYGGEPLYYEEGFLTVQATVAYAIIAVQSNISMEQLPHMYMKRFPYPTFIYDPLLKVLESFVAMIILLSFTYPCLSVVRLITTEKEKQLKDYMIIMGLPNWVFWSSWFITCVSFHMIGATIFIVLMKIPWVPGYEANSVFSKSSFLALWVFLLVYIIAVVTFSFLITTWFNKVNTASLVALLAWYISFLPFLYLKRVSPKLDMWAKLLQCFFFNSAMSYGFTTIIKLEGQGEGLRFHNFNNYTFSENNLTMNYIIMMLLIDSIIHMLLALYIENICPGPGGIPLKWNYLCKKNYWVKNKKQLLIYDTNEERYKNAQGANANRFEPPDPDFRIAIQIIHLKKQYSRKQIALRDLTLNIYFEKITVLLGHNGAGKTTMLSILIGRIPPTSGTAIVNGYDIRTQTLLIRKTIGVCPQCNVLYGDLTVFEHLYFYCRIKDMGKEDIDAECEKYIKELELSPKAGTKADHLSGGMQRKLSIAIALCANSKIVILDEPTAGIDPTARRNIWNLLIKEKPGRAILISTHFMDEAEHLGDHIAILARGVLQCCGSSFFLKKAVGLGYTLTLEMSENGDIELITAIINLYIPDMEVARRMGSELTFKLPINRQSVFSVMLRQLEARSQKLGIKTFGISYATMEEVFMRVGTFEAEKKEDLTRTLHEFDETEEEYKKRDPMAAPVATGCKLHGSRLKALLAKKLVVGYRNYVHVIMQCLIPIFFVLVAVAIFHAWLKREDMPKRSFLLAEYSDPVAVVSLDPPLKNEVPSILTTDYYESYIQLIKNEKSKIYDVQDDNMSNAIIDVTKKHEQYVRRHYIIGARFVDEKNVLALFNNQPYHARPTAIQYVANAIYQEWIKNQDYGVHFTNYPLPPDGTDPMKGSSRTNNLALHLAFNLGFGMSVLAAFFIIYYISERVCRSKRIQFISGANTLTFWSTSFTMDYLIYLLPCACLIITLAIFQERAFCTADDLSRVMILLAIFGFVTLPLNYVISFFCDVPTTGYATVVVLHLISGPTMFLLIQILSTPVLGIEYQAEILHYCMLIFPVYFFISAIDDTYRVHEIRYLCNHNCETKMPSMSKSDCWDLICEYQDQCCDKDIDYFNLTRPGIGWNCIVSMVTGFVLFLILIAIELELFQKMCKFKEKMPKPVDDEVEEKEVHMEKMRIRNYTKQDIHQFVLVIQDISKYYKNFLAVKNISFEVPKSQCFGLLGLNGAGKTSLFKIMNGETKASYGDGFVQGMSMKQDMPKILPIIGYCPQFDALMEELTPRETISLYCWLRGISNEDTKKITKYLAKEFDFERYLDKRIEKCSGGNKRKISVALCLIGNPVILLLDEPTTGIDSVAKRRIWTSLWKIREHGRSIILTSHSMEECEALCTRLAVMVNGQFQCIGSSQHLKSTYSHGYTLMIKPQRFFDEKYPADWKIDEIARFLTEHFGTVVFLEKFESFLKYQITNSRLPLSMMFEIMEQHKERLQIVHYALGQITLEEIFFMFTKYQRGEM